MHNYCRFIFEYIFHAFNSIFFCYNMLDIFLFKFLEPLKMKLKLI